MDPAPSYLRRAFAFVALASVLTSSSEALAYRPFDGTDADVAAPGEFELEMGPSCLAGRAVRPTLGLPALVLNQGLGGGWEAVAEATNTVSLAPPPGEKTLHLTDTDVQLKYVLRRGSLQGFSGPSVATEFGPLLPTLSGDRYGGDANIIVSQRVSLFTLHFNGGAALTRTSKYLFVGSIIIEGPELHRVRPVVELLIERELAGASRQSVLVGALWRANSALVFDFGTRGADIAGNPAVEVRLGLTWTTPVWEIAPSVVASPGRTALASPTR